jgi:hypothetical protein
MRFDWGSLIEGRDDPPWAKSVQKPSRATVKDNHFLSDAGLIGVDETTSPACPGSQKLVRKMMVGRATTTIPALSTEPYWRKRPETLAKIGQRFAPETDAIGFRPRYNEAVEITQPGMWERGIDGTFGTTL